ncbi:hypothetical protein B1B05_12590 [Domibacillus enclensis]|uniref:Uncharacterized protein n=1 Tax=Domibacillus enclensis TaxID=1017273 RepID=A0ABX4E6G0_9BACI|nr:hypothetical protein B1B05_12590 [Domibacillus enclensis]
MVYISFLYAKKTLTGTEVSFYSVEKEYFNEKQVTIPLFKIHYACANMVWAASAELRVRRGGR